MKSAGRRGKYREWLTEEGLKKIEAWAEGGLIEKDIAHNMGIAQQTLDLWKTKYPTILEALKRGKRVVDEKVESALLKRALGYEFEEVKTYIEETADGKIRKKKEITIKHIAPDTTAQIFWLRNRRGEDWSNKDQIDIERIRSEIARNETYIGKIQGLGTDFEDISVLVKMYEQDNENSDKDD